MPIYYLSKQGNDSNTGITPREAVKTFTRLNQLMQSGDIAYIAPGTYPVFEHGKFSPINNTPLSDTGQMTIIADTSGKAFGVEAGEVVVDALNSGATRIVDIPSTWSGRIVFKNFKFKNVKVTSPGVVGGVLHVPQANTNAVQIQFYNCVFTNIQNAITSGAVDGLFGYFYFNHTLSHLLMRDCTIGLGATTNYNSTVFSFHSSITDNPYTDLPSESHQVKLVNTTIFQEENATIVSDYHHLFTVGYHRGNNTYTNSGHFRILLKGCTIKPKSSEVYLRGYLVYDFHGGASLDIDDCNIIIRNIGYYGMNANSICYVNIRRSSFRVFNCTFPARSSVNIQHSKFAIGNSFGVQGDNIDVTCEKCFFVNVPNTSPDISIAYDYISTVFVDTVFSGFERINVSGVGKNSVFKRCLFVNCGSHQTTSSTNYILSGMGQYCRVVDSIVLKANSSASTFYSNSDSSDYVIFQNILASFFSVSGKPYYYKYNIGTISRNLSERPFVPLPDVIVPEKDEPISGTQSALIPIACIGRGKFRVLLEGGRTNTISLTLQKSWRGGKVEFWIENTKLNATVDDVTTPQTINISVTPDKSGMYELEIFGYDAVGQMNFTTNYQPNFIKIDSVVVA